MKSLLIAATVVLGAALLIVLAPNTARAANCNGAILCTPDKTGVCNNPDATSTPAICGDNSSGGSNPIIGSGGVLDEAVSILTFVAAAFAVIMIIVSGIRMMLSRGDPNGFNSARNGLIFAAIGLVVAILTRVIVLFILKYI